MLRFVLYQGKVRESPTTCLLTSTYQLYTCRFACQAIPAPLPYKRGHLQLLCSFRPPKIIPFCLILKCEIGMKSTHSTTNSVPTSHHTSLMEVLSEAQATEEASDFQPKQVYTCRSTHTYFDAANCSLQLLGLQLAAILNSLVVFIVAYSLVMKRRPTSSRYCTTGTFVRLVPLHIG